MLVRLVLLIYLYNLPLCSCLYWNTNHHRAKQSVFFVKITNTKYSPVKTLEDRTQDWNIFIMEVDRVVPNHNHHHTNMFAREGWTLLTASLHSFSHGLDLKTIYTDSFCKSGQFQRSGHSSYFVESCFVTTVKLTTSKFDYLNKELISTIVPGRPEGNYLKFLSYTFNNKISRSVLWWTESKVIDYNQLKLNLLWYTHTHKLSLWSLESLDHRF